VQRELRRQSNPAPAAPTLIRINRRRRSSPVPAIDPRRPRRRARHHIGRSPCNL